MQQRIRYLSHPEVAVDPATPVPDWSLSATGHQRVQGLTGAAALERTAVVISSAERKALDTAKPLAEALSCPLEIRPRMHENDRSATGFLPPQEFEQVADQFFAQPDTSIRGWETARDAQARIVQEIADCLRQHPEGDLLFTGHGGVGTLLYCHLAGLQISRGHDQLAGGGCYLEWPRAQPGLIRGWQRLEQLIAPPS